MKNFLTELRMPQKDGFYQMTVQGAVPLPKLQPTDRIFLPVDEGIVINTGEKQPFGDLQSPLCAREGTLSLLLIQRDKQFLLISPVCGLHTSYVLKWKGNQYDLHLENARSETVRYQLYPSLVQACKAYRAALETTPRSLKEKLSCLPEAKKLIGGAIFWIWSSNYDQVMYADHNVALQPETGEDLLKIASDLHQSGVEKAMFGIFFDDDSKYVKPLYESFGYISTQYDNYDDVLNPALLDLVPSNRAKHCGYTARRMKDYPNGAAIAEDGTPQPAWALKGFDGKFYEQNKVCPQIAEQRVKEEVPPILQKYPFYKGRFLDVFGTSLPTCHSKTHPVSVETCAQIKNSTFCSLESMGLIPGTEDGFELLIDHLYYTEGLHSPSIFRNRDSGRRHTRQYTDEECIRLKAYMLDPKRRVPLWELVYHENLLIFPYWGDSTACALQYLQDRILFACLFGTAPLFSFKAEDYAKLKPYILKCYHAICNVHQKTAMLPMTDYQIFTEDASVQTTVFEKKYRVIVNFSDTDYLYNGKTVPAKDFLCLDI